MTYDVRRKGQVDVGAQDRVVLSGERLGSADFRGRRFGQFLAEGVRLEGCAFDGAVIENASFGAGRVASEYVGCSFDGAKLRMGPGGFARFVDCSFENTVIENWFCFAVELVGCSFSGRLRKVVFNGTVRSKDREITGRTVNQFERNDFSRAKLVDVAFRTGVDLTKQRLPTGSEYAYLADAASAVRRARIDLNSWEDPDAKKRASGVLQVMEEDVADGQRQLLIRADDYPRASRPAIRSLLTAAQES
ncbi:hypothetical protein [Kribbella sp. NPDC050470]|uniref:hypothetical protein n=1 Tax=unclassified Kribbella TaxID=2644121 RepID=UPI00378FCD3D